MLLRRLKGAVKMKRRILSVLLMLCLVLTTVAVLASCGRVEKTLEKAMEKTEALEEFEIEMRQVSTVEVQGQKQKVALTTNMKVKDAKSDNPTIWMEIEIEMGGEKQTTEMYIEDGWMYMAYGDSGYKAKLEDIGEDEDDYLAQVDNIVKELPEDVLKSAEYEREDGKKIITATIDGKLMDDLFEELIDEALAGYGYDDDLLEELSISFDDAEVEIEIKDGYIFSYELDYDMDIEVMGETAESDNTVKIKYIDPGEAVSITPPKGYQNFSEMN